MDKKTINRMASLAGIICILAGCAGRTEGCGDAEELAAVRIDLQPEGFAATRSSFSRADSEINDIQIVITEDDGTVCDVLYSQSASGLSFTGLAGHHYNVCAAANLGQRTSVSGMKAYNEMTSTVSAADIARNGVPMYSAEGPGITLVKGDNSLTLNMVRLVARIDFNIDRSLLGSSEGFTVKSVRTFNSEGNAFDTSSAADVLAVNSGRSISLYAYENMQGTLLPGNSDPWAKVPDKLGPAAGRCSFLEVKCSYSYLGKSCEDITYRMYLGNDATTNFDVRRNTVYRLTLIPTEEEIYGDRGSWKIESGWWDDRSPVSLAFAETAKTIYINGPNAGGNGKWTTDLVVTYADGSNAHVTGTVTGSSPSVASVSGMTVTGKSVGTSILNGSYTEYGVTVSTDVPAVVTVTDPLLALRLEPEEVHIPRGKSYSDWTVEAVYPSGDRVIANDADGLVWSLDSSTHLEPGFGGRTSYNFIKIETDGTVQISCTAKAPDNASATLTATLTDNGVTRSASSAIDNTSEKVIDHYELVVSPSSLEIETGSTGQVRARLRPVYTDNTKGSLKAVEACWTTASGSNAIVSNTYLNRQNAAVSLIQVAGVTAGTDVITATYASDGITYTDTCDVTVVEPSKPDEPDKPDVPDQPDQPDQPDDPDNPDKPDLPDEPEVTYGYRLEIVNGGRLGVGDNATFIVRLYTDIYHDGTLYRTDTEGTIIDNSLVNWGFGTDPQDISWTDSHATLTQEGVITGAAAGHCTVIATLKTDTEVFATKGIEVIESSAGIDLSIVWDGTWARIDIDF